MFLVAINAEGLMFYKEFKKKEFAIAFADWVKDKGEYNDYDVVSVMLYERCDDDKL